MKLASSIDSKINFSFALFLISMIAILFYHYIDGSTFLIPPQLETRFGDFDDVVPINLGHSAYDIFNSPYIGSGVVCYFPFTYLFFFFFFSIFKSSSFAIMILIYIFSLIYFGFKNFQFSSEVTNIYKFLCIAIFSYGSFYVIERGNVDMLILSFLLLSFSYAERNKSARNILLACAIAFKAIPAIFLFHYLKNKEYKDIILVAFTALLLTVISLFMMQGGTTGMIANINAFHQQLIHFQNYFVDQRKIVQGNSIYHFLCVLSLLFPEPTNILHAIVEYSIAHYVVIAFLLGLILLGIYIWKLNRLTNSQSILYLTVLMCWLPMISYDYKRIFFIMPFGFFLIEKDEYPHKWIYCVLYILVFVPVNIHLESLIGITNLSQLTFPVEIILINCVFATFLGLIILDMFPNIRLNLKKRYASIFQ